MSEERVDFILLFCIYCKIKQSFEGQSFLEELLASFFSLCIYIALSLCFYLLSCFVFDKWSVFQGTNTLASNSLMLRLALKMNKKTLCAYFLQIFS